MSSFTYTFFDTETTGFINKNLPPDDANQAHICQLAALTCDHEGKELMRMNVLIKPTNWVISQRLTDIHGISHQMAVEKGIPIAEALTQFGSCIKPSNVLVAHNFEFDKNMIRLERDANKFDLSDFDTKSTCCTMINGTEICRIPKARGSGYKWPKLMELHKVLFDCEFEGAHDALADLLATKKCFFEMLRRETA